MRSPDRTKIEIPPGALLMNTEISIKVASPKVLALPSDEKIKLIGVARELEPSGLVFQKPIKITLPYTDVDLDSDRDNEPEYDENLLEGFFWDGRKWIKTGLVKRLPAENLVVITTNHFSLFALGIDNRAKSEKIEVWVEPNPFKVGGERGEVTFFCTSPQAARAKVEIYDIMGDLVWHFPEISVREDGQDVELVSWDGRNNYGRYVGSGLYIYRVVIKVNGKEKIFSALLGVVK